MFSLATLHHSIAMREVIDMFYEEATSQSCRYLYLSASNALLNTLLVHHKEKRVTVVVE